MGYGNGLNTPFGLRPVRSFSGGQWSEILNPYKLSVANNGVTTYATSLFEGDPMVMNPAAANGGGGTVARYAAATDGNGAGNIVSVVGRFSMVSYTDITGKPQNLNYWVGGTPVFPGTPITVLLNDDPDTVYEIQVSTWTNVEADTQFLSAGIGQNFGFGIGGGGNVVVNPAIGTTTTGSAFYLARVFTANDIAHTVATLPLKVLGYSRSQQQIINGIYQADGVTPKDYLIVEVMLNNHQKRAGTLGVVAA